MIHVPHAAAMLTLLVVILPAQAQHSPQDSREDAPVRPDPRLTPGAVATSDPAVFCRPGYSRAARHTSGRVKRNVYRAYGIDRRGGHYEIDHLVPLGLGGADVPANLWPESFDTDWGAEAKDRLEWRLIRLVCGGAVSAEQAQRDIAADWIAAYGRYCPTNADCPAYRAARGRME